MISTESAFNELGINAITGVELMDWLGLSQFDLADPSRFGRLSQVIDYFKQFPPDTQRYLIRRATSGKNVDKLNHVWEYSQLLSQRNSTLEEVAKAKAELTALGATPDPILFMDVDSRVSLLEENLGKIDREIGIYEK